MKVQLKRDGEEIEVKNLFVIIGETRYRLTETNQNELEINKHDLDDTSISISPCYANQIKIK
jgi:hypothetical protein